MGMDIEQILEALELYTGRFPGEAMHSAIEQREAITPELLRVMENVAENGEEIAKRKDYMLHSFAIHLLAQFRETRVFPSLVKIVSLPGELPFDLFGDTITEGLSQLLGSVYAGDPTPLQGLVEGESINEFVRSATLDSFIVLERSDQMSRDEVVSYFRSLFQGKLSRSDSCAWPDLIRSCADLPAPELLHEVRQVFEKGTAGFMRDELILIERRLMSDEKTIRVRTQRQFSLITDAIGEMEWWAAFHPEPAQAPRLKTARGPKLKPIVQHHDPNPSTALKNEMRKIGRNEACPCGSGKKFKKCCQNKP